MTLREVMGNGAPEVEVSALAYRSDRVRPGTLFFCVPGQETDGHDYAADAVRRGAVALVCERPLDLGVPEVIVPSARAAMGPAAARFFGHPSARLAVVGVTGTNGKTTVTYLVRSILERSGLQTGLLGTVSSVIGGEESPTERTTPEAIDLQQTLRAMVDGGDRACAMEVSSHALHQGRADGVRFAARVFTNLTKDHLDYHETMEPYFRAKRMLFEEHRGGTAVINADDAYGRRLLDELPDATSFAIDAEADFRARDVTFDDTGSRFTCETPDAGPLALETQLLGRFNVENALAALAASRAVGASYEAIAAALRDAPRVPGRFELVEEGQDFTVLVDYAHTPDAVRNALGAAREITRGRLHVVLGAGGDRDRTKRPEMGAAAAELADRVVVTSDNPRNEDPERIIDAVVQGAGTDAVREVDRRRAIALAIGAAEPGDVVVIAGKGHEQGQEFERGRKEPFDDVTVAREALRERLGAAESA